MAHCFTVTIRNKKTGEAQSVSREFLDDEWARLIRFRDNASRLLATGLFQRQALPSYAFRWDREFGVSHLTVLPSDDDADAFLHRMRRFILKREPIFFKAVCNIISRRVDLPMCTEAIDKQKDRFACKRLGFSIQAGPLVLTSDAALEKWLYACEYHEDDDKPQDLAALYEIFPKPAARALFLTSLLEKAAAVATVASLIDAIEERKGAIRDL